MASCGGVSIPPLRMNGERTYAVLNLLGVVVAPPSDGGPLFLRGESCKEVYRSDIRYRRGV